MASPPPHGSSLGVWKVTHKIAGLLVLTKENVSKPVVIPITPEEAEYFVVGQSYSFSATQP
jgi:hypothetical protein